MDCSALSSLPVLFLEYFLFDLLLEHNALLPLLVLVSFERDVTTEAVVDAPSSSSSLGAIDHTTPIAVQVIDIREDIERTRLWDVLVSWMHSDDEDPTVADSSSSWPSSSDRLPDDATVEPPPPRDETKCERLLPSESLRRRLESLL